VEARVCLGISRADQLYHAVICREALSGTLCLIQSPPANHARAVSSDCCAPRHLDASDGGMHRGHSTWTLHCLLPSQRGHVTATQPQLACKNPRTISRPQPRSSPPRSKCYNRPSLYISQTSFSACCDPSTRYLITATSQPWRPLPPTMLTGSTYLASM
jgi:hypothetical protein